MRILPRRGRVQTIILALVLDSYAYTYLPNSRTQLGFFRVCVYREYRPILDAEKRYRWYLTPYSSTRCDPYVYHRIPISK